MKNDMSVTINYNFRKRKYAQERRRKYFKIHGYENKHTYVKYKNKVIPVMRGGTGIISKSYRKYQRTYLESTTSRNYRKQPYRAVYTYLGKC